jgi:hypothetical protein
LALAIFAGQSLAAPVLTQPPAPPQQQGKRDLHKKHSRPEMNRKPVHPAKAGSRINAPAVKGVIANDFKMNTDSLPMFLRRDGLAAATLDNGSFICAWTDYRNGYFNIRFQWFTGQGLPAGDVYSTDAGNTYQTEPAVAVGPNGTFAISWMAYDDFGTQHLYCRTFGSSNNPLDTTIRVDVANSQHAYDQAIAATDSGFAVIWADYHEGPWRVYYQLLDTVGHLTGSNVWVGPDGGSQQTNPTVGTVGQGFVATWAANNGVCARRYDAVGNAIGSFFQVNGAPAQNISRSAICATDSGFAIAWNDRRNSSNDDIYLQRFDTAGAYVGGNINVTNFSYDASYPSIASRNGQDVVAWQDERSGNKDVYAQWYKPNGDTLGGQMVLNDDTTTYDQQYPVALAGDSGWTLCWLDARNYDRQVVYGQSYDTIPAAQGANLMLSDSTAGVVGQYYPAVTAGQDGKFLAVWADDRNSVGNNEDVYGRLYSKDGAALTPDFLISDTSYSPGDRSAYDPKVKGLADGSYLVAWYDNRNASDYDIYGQRLDAAGNIVGGNYQISTTDPGYDDYDLSIAAADSGYGVFWYAYDPSWSNSNIYGRVFKTNGDSVGTTMVINDVVSSSSAPSAAANDSGMVVVWYDYRDGSYYHIYGQRMLWDGNLSGGNYLVGDSIDVHQEDPSIAGTNSGFMVTWYNYYGGNSDIYAQRLDAIGQKVNTNFAVSTESGLYHEYPSVAASPDGDRYAIFWYTWTGSHDLLFSQRYQNGRPQGVNDLLVDTADWGRLETYGAQNIAATDDRLFFTWHGIKNGSRTLYDAYGMVTDWYATALPPAFAWIDSLPNDPDSAYGPYPVKAAITDDNGIEHAVLYYQINGGAWDTLGMAAGTADTFSAVIPEQSLALGDTVFISYYVWAMDNAKNWITSSSRSFMLTYPTGVAGQPEGTLPKVYALRPCWPNPSSGRVSFGYQLPKASQVSLTVYNIAGQEVKRFERGAQPAGSYSIDWKDGKVSAGVYFYRLQAGDFVSTRKLTIVR